MPDGTGRYRDTAGHDPGRFLAAVLLAMLACAAAPPGRTASLTSGDETLRLALPDGFRPETGITPAARAINYVHAVNGSMDLQQGGLSIRASRIEGAPSPDDLLAALVAQNADRCPTAPAVDNVTRFTDAGVPALTALLRCGPGSTGRPGSVAALKLIRGRQAQFTILRIWQVEATGPSAAVPFTDAMRADASAVLGSAHVCPRGTACH